MEIRTQQAHYRDPITTSGKATAAAGKATAAAGGQAQALPSDTYTPLTGYVDPDVSAPTLPTSAPPALPRPVVFVHGFTGDPGSFNAYTDWLSSGSKPVNKFGGIIEANKLDKLDGTANLFTLRLSRPFNGIEKNSAELKTAVEAICRATGQPEVDLVVHSLGGLDTRDYLREPDEKVKRVVMLGTPNHGSQLSNLEIVFREKFGYPIKPPEDDPEVRTVLHQLQVDRNDRSGRPENPYLRELNNGWAAQRSKAEILIIAGAGIPTLTGPVGITALGDGVVPRKSADLEGVETKTAWFKTHGALLKTAGVIENAANFLATGKALTPGENIYDSPADEARAKELMAREAAREKAAQQAAQAGAGAAKPGKASLAQVQGVAQLPVLDPAFQFGLGLGVLAALMGGPKEALPLVNIGLSSTQGESTLQAAYNVDLTRSSDPVRGSGTSNGTSFAETANLVDGKLYWNSQNGPTASGLVMEVGDDERSITMKGQLSGVDADLRLAAFTDSEGNVAGIETKGTLNGEQYFMKSTVDVESLFSAGSSAAGRQGEMHVVGLVQGQAVEKSYQVAVQKQGGGLHLTARGQGLNVGQAQGVAVDIHVTDRD
jgi:pimeloyl-ACP methyl ester carboxylesterase